MSALSHAVRTRLLPLAEVSRLASLRRFTSLFSQGQTADALYFVEDGLVKLTRTNQKGDRIILSMCGAGELIGEEALCVEPCPYDADAEILTTATLYCIPAAALQRILQTDPGFALSVIDFLLKRRHALAQKVELLCLHDVEHRILFYLAEFSTLLQPSNHTDTYQVPITQSELADLVGATRETTSTTLNQLERKGLVILSRRLLTIPSVQQIRAAIGQPTAAAATT